MVAQHRSAGVEHKVKVLWRPSAAAMISCLLLPLILSVPMPAVAPSVPVSSEAGRGLGRPVCHRSRASVILKEEGDHILPGGDRVMCASSSDYCFSFWTYDNDNDDDDDGNDGNDNNDDGNDNNNSRRHVKWLAQGCFSSSEACEQSECSATRESPRNSFFCCCRGDLCNGNVVVPPLLQQPQEAGTSREDVATSRELQAPQLLVVAVVAAVVVAVASVVAALLWRRRRQRKMSLQDLGDLTACKAGRPVGGGAPGWGSVDISSVQLTDVIGRGRFGCVYKASVKGLKEEVVVKVFSEGQKESYTNELFIYSHPFMQHSNLLTCLGYGRLGSDGYGLVLPYCSGGRLSTHLTHHTLTFPQLCRVVITATRGLAHLHAPITAAGQHKPSMAHRDFNTRNLALREDLSCVVIDLGLAVCVKGASHSRPGRPYTHGTPPALNEVGSVRYMAPELLEGAVNLTECEAALRQIDVYALALVLWECVTRCTHLSPTPPPYMLPFQRELGAHVQLDQMIELVVKEKRRPLFPDTLWSPAGTRDVKTSHEKFEERTTGSCVSINDDVNLTLSDVTKTHDDAFVSSKHASLARRILRDTIEECWDADSEARLSAQCVLERLEQLPQLWRSQGDAKISKSSSKDLSKNGGHSILRSSKEIVFGNGSAIDSSYSEPLTNGSSIGNSCRKPLNNGSSTDFSCREPLTNGSAIDFSCRELELPAYTSDCDTRNSLSSGRTNNNFSIKNSKRNRTPAHNSTSHHDCHAPLLDRSPGATRHDSSGSRDIGRQLLPTSARHDSSDGRDIGHQFHSTSARHDSSGSRDIGSAFVGTTSSGGSEYGERDESSTRTHDTLLSPSLPGQPYLMHAAGQTSNKVYQGRCDGPAERGLASVLQKGSSSPVCVLQSPSSPSAGDTAPFIGSPGASKNFWLKLKQKFRPDNRKAVIVEKQKMSVCGDNRTSRDHPARSGQQLSLYCTQTSPSPRPPTLIFEQGRQEINVSQNPDKVHGSRKLLETCEPISGEPGGLSVEESVSKSRESPSRTREFLSDKLLYRLCEVSAPKGELHKEELVSDLHEFSPKLTAFPTEKPLPNLRDFQPRKIDETWTSTVPQRRHPEGKRRLNNRPASLEIRTPSQEKEEDATPLSAYLSSSCNFNIPQEIVLRKSKTRVKTPRHPPLPRLSLNAEPFV
ncbi:uncharacterized protein LOC108679446 [Hyalella azteca]|uniref:receptor protein serine/threonine kinase n=1 Tax=Hyalella azteca TaxID=294128 RepID=A0A8B7PBL7_HYAAZ|nr:uncharacterized protein LOC108679446 [Hyalella azteca]